MACNDYNECEVNIWLKMHEWNSHGFWQRGEDETRRGDEIWISNPNRIFHHRWAYELGGSVSAVPCWKNTSTSLWYRQNQQLEKRESHLFTQHNIIRETSRFIISLKKIDHKCFPRLYKKHKTALLFFGLLAQTELIRRRSWRRDRKKEPWEVVFRTAALNAVWKLLPNVR